MNKVYDPILCMNIPVGKSKTKDARVVDAGADDIETVLKNFNKSSDFGDSVKVSLSNGKTAIVQKEYDGWYASVDGKRTKGSLQVIIGFLKSSSRDSISSIDKAIKACDADVKLVKTIASRNGYSVHIVESKYGKRLALTFKGESYKNPHMWLGEANEANKNKAIEMMNEFAGLRG